MGMVNEFKRGEKRVGGGGWGIIHKRFADF